MATVNPFAIPLTLANLPSYLATVQKIIGEILKSEEGMSFSRDLLIDMCVEFIGLISSEANEIAEKENKKTISPEHIGAALKDLGFAEYVEDVLGAADEMKEQFKVSGWRGFR